MTTANAGPGSQSNQSNQSNRAITLALAWLAVGVPLLWGVVQTLKKALALFA